MGSAFDKLYNKTLQLFIGFFIFPLVLFGAKIENGHYIQYTCIKSIVTPTCPNHSSFFSVGYYSNNIYYGFNPNNCLELTRTFTINTNPERFAFEVQVLDSENNFTTIISEEHIYRLGEATFNMAKKESVGGTCSSLFDVYYKVLVDNPIAINSIKFKNYATQEIYENNSICSSDISNLGIIINYDGQFYENSCDRKYQICLNKSNDWININQTIETGTNNENDEIRNLFNYISPGDTFQIRTAKTLINGDISTVTYPISFSIGEEFTPTVIEEKPYCKDDVPILKITAPVGETYDFVIRYFDSNSSNNESGQAFEYKGYQIKYENEYIIDNRAPGIALPMGVNQQELTIISSDKGKCPMKNVYDILSALPLSITSHTMPEPFTDNEGNIIHIKKRGDAAEISFAIKNSRHQNLNITAIESGTETNVILPNGPDNDGYYSGTVYAKGKAGDQEFNIKNGYGCSKTFMIKILI